MGPPRPTLVADEAIACLDALFEGRARVVRRPGASIDRADLVGADVLLVRSVTRVGADLVAGTPVRFVGSVTAGIDHVDVEDLASLGIEFANSPGANAEAVAQYVVTALLYLSVARGLDLGRSTLGIVGRGHVGSRVARHARRLGLAVLVCDPPLDRAGDPGPFVPLEVLLEASDIVTLHVPLVRAGADRTIGLLGREALARIRPGAFLVNTSRGDVVDEAALHAALDDGRLAGAILDVFAGEPAVDPDLVRRAEFATPHIAGYSEEAKAAVTLAVYRRLAPRYGWPDVRIEDLVGPTGDFHPLPPTDPERAIAATGLLEVSRRLQAAPEGFARLRLDYVHRREVFR